MDREKVQGASQRLLFTYLYLSMDHQIVQTASQRNLFIYIYLKTVIGFKEHPKDYSFLIFMDHEKKSSESISKATFYLLLLVYWSQESLAFTYIYW